MGQCQLVAKNDIKSESVRITSNLLIIFYAILRNHDPKVTIKLMKECYYFTRHKKKTS